MAKRRTPSGIVDQLRDYLQELPVKRAVGDLDRRSIGRTQRIERELSAEGKPSEIAKGLGISTQKWVSMRRGIREGKIASPTVADLMQRTTAQKVETPVLEKVKYSADIPHKGRRVRESQVWETSETWVKKNAPWMRDLKPGGFLDRRSAANWWGNAGAGSQYFALVKKTHKGGRVRWHIYDMRTPKELASKGDQRGQLRAQKLLKKYE